MMFAAGRQIEVPLTDFYYRGFFVFPAVRGEKAFNRLSWGGGGLDTHVGNKKTA